MCHNRYIFLVYIKEAKKCEKKNNRQMSCVRLSVENVDCGHHDGTFCNMLEQWCEWKATNGIRLQLDDAIPQIQHFRYLQHLPINYYIYYHHLVVNALSGRLKNICKHRVNFESIGKITLAFMQTDI